MEAYLDTKTLSVVTVLLSFSYFIGLLLLQRIQEPINGLNLLALSLFFIGLGFLVLGTENSGSPLIEMLASSLVGLAFALLVHGIHRFRQTPFDCAKVSYAILPIVVILLAYFSYLSPSEGARIVVLSLYIVLCTGLAVFANTLGNAEDLKPAKFILTVGLSIEGCFMMFEIFWRIITPGESPEASAQVIHQISLISIILMIILFGFSISWMITGRLVATMYDSSIRDGLTGLYNRRALEELAPKEMARAQRHSDHLSIVLIDIDAFKKINDTYGHQVGDSVLRKAAKLILQATRKEDISFRYGGEEFLVILPATSIDQAAIVASKLRRLIEKSSLLPSHVDKCTASFGVAQFSLNEGWDKLLERADKALYMAKDHGRNAVFVADTGDCYPFEERLTARGNVSEQPVS
ncbi:GGDEF domain-containing protein [Vibrio sp. S4M6]|uniref:GGDEF domain-containing protein n=1 Tax=Vibrio sinus TaxID=2946865 RepID=UPI00202A5E8F|nr:GGDEF domain-containing protein [Vibrio sinus]MCL9780604.1 GGDEF domain-containing protein [Vibrio sinus]